MPQPCWTRIPNSSFRQRTIAGGQAEPPITTFSRVENRSPCCFMWLMRPSHTVGTPEERFTFSVSNSSYRLAPSRPGPGNTSLAPTSGAAYGMPQALTWNIGTIGRIALREDRSVASGSEIAYACSTVERWLKSTPFGLPVVPEV